MPLVLQSEVQRILEHSELDGNFSYLQTLAEAAQAAATAADLTASEAASDVATKAGTDSANIFTQVQTFGKGVVETKVDLAANNIDLAAGSLFKKTISGATTLTVSNVPAAGNVAAFILDLTNAGSATITWWSGMKWAGGTAPTFTAAGRDMVGFITYDGGTTWTGVMLAKDAK